MPATEGPRACTRRPPAGRRVSLCPGQACETLAWLTLALWKLERILLPPAPHRGVLKMDQVIVNEFWVRNGKKESVPETPSPLFPLLGAAGPVSIYKTTRQRGAFHVTWAQEVNSEEKLRNTWKSVQRFFFFFFPIWNGAIDSKRTTLLINTG